MEIYILSKGYKSKHKYVYCGETINVDLIYKDESIVKLKYTKNGDGYFILKLYPVRTKEMIDLLNKAGFEAVYTYGDFEKNYDPNNTDFIQNMAVK